MDCLHVLALIYYTPQREQKYISQLSSNIFMHSSVLNEAITFFSVTNAPLEGIYYSDFIQVKHSKNPISAKPVDACARLHKYTLRFTLFLFFFFFFKLVQLCPVRSGQKGRREDV